MDYKKSKAPVNTVTRNIMDLCDQTGNIYESVAIISKRANQIAVEIKQDLNKKLAEFASYNDSLEEVFENREQIEISRYYEKLPKPTLLATQEFIEGNVYFRDPSQDNNQEHTRDERSAQLGNNLPLQQPKAAEQVLRMQPLLAHRLVHRTGSYGTQHVVRRLLFQHRFRSLSACRSCHPGVQGTRRSDSRRETRARSRQNKISAFTIYRYNKGWDAIASQPSLFYCV